MSDNNKAPKPPEPPIQQPQLPKQDLSDTHVDMQTARSFKSAQNLVLVASLAGPVSLFIGGVLLSGAGFVCAILGFRKLSALSIAHEDMKLIISRVKRSCIIAMVICSISVVLNAISAFIMYPVVMDALESGQYSEMLSNGGTSTNNPGGNSTWG